MACSASSAERLLHDMREHAALLLERGPGEYGFIHLTFQEYLAAVAIGQLGQTDTSRLVQYLVPRIGVAAWREVVLLVVGYLGIVQKRDQAASEVVEALLTAPGSEPGQAIALAGDDASPGG